MTRAVRAIQAAIRQGTAALADDPVARNDMDEAWLEALQFNFIQGAVAGDDEEIAGSRLARSGAIDRNDARAARSALGAPPAHARPGPAHARPPRCGSRTGPTPIRRRCRNL